MSQYTQEHPYQVLGISRQASEAEVRQAYFSLVREHPPERDPEGFKRIRAAYEQLKSRQARQDTDLKLVDEYSANEALAAISAASLLPPLTANEMQQDLLALEALLLLETLSKTLNLSAAQHSSPKA